MVVATTIKITGPRKLLPISPRAMPLLATIRAPRRGKSCPRQCGPLVVLVVAQLGAQAAAHHLGEHRHYNEQDENQMIAGVISGKVTCRPMLAKNRGER